jgi:hypothetical protein
LTGLSKTVGLRDVPVNRKYSGRQVGSQDVPHMSLRYVVDLHNYHLAFPIRPILRADEADTCSLWLGLWRTRQH